jgi:DnaK suppressor protein
MISSFLQLMGFRPAKPVHSRASESTETPSAATSIEGISSKNAVATNPNRKATDKTHAQAHSSRKTDVKSKAIPVPVPAKAIAATAAPVAKPVPKAVAKAVTKAVTKTVAVPAKVVAKSVAKPAGKAVPPVVPIVAPKVTAAKPGVAKPVLAKVAVKEVVKSVEVSKNQKPLPKGAAKPVNEIVKKATPSVVKSIPAPVAVPVAAPVLQAPVLPSASLVPAVKAGRPSSRLAQLTVPSMAQSVASTAAKSSYTQTTSMPLIVPPLPSATKKDAKLVNNWKTKPVEQMSDAELIAMPDSEYMNDKQMAVFRLKLSVLKQDILNSAGETTEHLREDTVVVPDPADRATIEEEHALELRTRDRERKLLKKIEQSINRIDAGDYGYCDETGEPIGVGRLLARPTATLSLEAQQRRELKQKMFGD